MAEPKCIESFKVAGTQLVDAVKKLIREGNVRRVVVKHDTHTAAESSLTAGVVGAVLAPLLAAVGVIAIALKECTVEVGRATDVQNRERGVA